MDPIKVSKFTTNQALAEYYEEEWTVPMPLDRPANDKPRKNLLEQISTALHNKGMVSDGSLRTGVCKRGFEVIALLFDVICAVWEGRRLALQEPDIDTAVLREEIRKGRLPATEDALASLEDSLSDTQENTAKLTHRRN